VLAAGNNNNCIKSYPAAYDHVVAVAATNQNDKRCSPDDWGQGEGSNYGDWVDIAAPGNLIYTTTPTYDFYFHDVDNASLYYEWARGTSFATPMVAGVAALLLSKDSSLTPDEVTAFLCGNVDPYNSTEYIGTGRLNAQKALLALSSDSKVTINGGLGIQAVITNQGPSDVTGIDWQIHVQGGILGLVNKTVSGTVDLKAGESQTVSLRPFFGLGNIVISVRVGDVGKAVRGIQLAIYSMVK
jgi:subtilisin family serine protease